MKILVSSLVFYPDHSGIALYSTDFAFYAAEQGHEVHVVTGFPFYPKWKKKASDRRVLFRTDEVNKVKIHRGYLYVPQNPRTHRRIIQEITFLISAVFNFIKVGRPDVIVLFTTPVSLGVAGWIFKKIFRTKLVINVQDFQVEAADSLGMLSKFSFLKTLVVLEKFTYRQSNLVSSISDSMVDIIKEKGIDQKKVIYWPNWIDVAEAAKIGEQENFRKKYALPLDKMIIAYAGNVGLKQGLSTLIDLAEAYKENEKLHFLIVGEGGDLGNLKKYHKQKKLSNMTFLPFLDADEYKDMLGDVDVIFISQKKVPKDIYFPSKLLGLMAASKLIFLSADKNSELYKVVSKNKLGLVTEFGDMDNMKACVNQILHAPEELKMLQRNAWEFVQRFDRKVVLQSVLEKISQLLVKPVVVRKKKTLLKSEII